MKILYMILLPTLALTACGGNLINAVPVTDFESDRYLGTWYEIARLDHSFERGLSNVTATYTQRDDGAITVFNRGYKDKTGVYEDARGKAKFAINDTTGHLKVSFFGPFYGDYIIFDLDKTDYSYASISGGRDKYLWLLSRTPSVSDAVKDQFIKSSEALGYETGGLIWVDHSRQN